MRFQHTFAVKGDLTVAWVEDTLLGRVVPNAVYDSVGEAMRVETILNQRVEHPELTRADGKLAV